ncbi:MAG: MotA/TolQ/ExbB proton channel family protein [Acholeplasmataceae bacterium]|nr:MotA/TolQ/ExbB proton channel family protein [Acholeplasmataceae bacterium]
MDSIKLLAEYFGKGGLVMWPLLLCSILVVTIAIERYLFYKETDSGSAFADKYSNLMAIGKIQEGQDLAEKTKGECARIVSETMKLNGNNTRKFNYMEAQAGLVIAKWRNRLSYLGVIVTLSPLLGLLGTIVGMINSFSIFNLKSGQPMAITGGIGEALIATATGLCVAIAALSVHSYFAQRLDTAITNMEQCFSALLEAGSRGED